MSEPNQNETGPAAQVQSIVRQDVAEMSNNNLALLFVGNLRLKLQNLGFQFTILRLKVSNYFLKRERSRLQSRLFIDSPVTRGPH